MLVPKVKPLVTKNPNDKSIIEYLDGRLLEEHGPYLHGSGFPAVNSWDPDRIQTFDPEQPPDWSHALTAADLVPSASASAGAAVDRVAVGLVRGRGVQYANKFMSEFGAAVMSSFESMSEFLHEDHWSLDGGGEA